MRKLLPVIAMSIFLASCATTGTGSFDPTKLQDLVDKIKIYTAQTCNLLPEAASVVSLISAFYPQAVIAANAIQIIGNAICQAPPALSIKRKAVGYSVRLVSAPNGKTIQVRVSPAR